MVVQVASAFWTSCTRCRLWLHPQIKACARRRWAFGVAQLRASAIRAACAFSSTQKTPSFAGLMMSQIAGSDANRELYYVKVDPRAVRRCSPQRSVRLKGMLTSSRHLLAQSLL